jgi:hypothetical protein
MQSACQKELSLFFNGLMSLPSAHLGLSAFF